MKKEICNAYTELNDPMRQRQLFEEQAKVRRESVSKGTYFIGVPTDWKISALTLVSHCLHLLVTSTEMKDKATGSSSLLHGEVTLEDGELD